MGSSLSVSSLATRMTLIDGEGPLQRYMPATPTKPRRCPDCRAMPGSPHDEGCDVERCGDCGIQRVQCTCANKTPEIWTGEWPGVVDCRRLGFWCMRNPVGPGWIPVPAGTSGAIEDLNRLATDTYWDAKLKRRMPNLKVLTRAEEREEEGERRDKEEREKKKRRN